MTSSVQLPTTYKIIICMVGLPLSGKSHVAGVIKKNIRCTHISTGDIARSLITNESDRVATVKADLYPDSKALQDVLMVELNAAPNGIILLDGFPRSKEQVEFMHDNLMLMFPVMMEAYVGDDSTLMARGLQRARDRGDQATELTARLVAAKKNMNEVHKIASFKMIDQYTIFSSGDEASILTQFNNILKKVIK